NEERNLGMRCIAAPVFDFNREVIAGISVSGPTSRVGTENLPAISVAVMHAAVALTEAIAGTSPFD
ncbi:MAG: IclR family transcriptional regulator domain-containing protein, partial [Paracoccaceae bacterium]